MAAMTQITPDITIISGTKNAGKTKFCLCLVEQLHKEAAKVSGLISPGLYEQGHKTGILVRDLSTGAEKQLAVFDPGWDPLVPQREWRFNDEVVEWGNDCLKKATPTDILLIDELGFMELEQNRGWTAGMEALDKGLFTHALAVIRPDLLKIARERWNPAYFLTITPSTDSEVFVNKLIAHWRESA